MSTGFTDPMSGAPTRSPTHVWPSNRYIQSWPRTLSSTLTSRTSPAGVTPCTVARGPGWTTTRKSRLPARKSSSLMAITEPVPQVRPPTSQGSRTYTVSWSPTRPGSASRGISTATGFPSRSR